MIVSVGMEFSMSDLASEILPKDPLSMIFPLIVEETNMSLKSSLLKLSSMVLRLLLWLVLGVVSSNLIESSYLC